MEENDKDTKSTNNYIPFSSNGNESASTVEYLNETIGDVIGDILDQCSKDTPPDPILYVAELLEREFHKKSVTPDKNQDEERKSRRKKRSKFKLAAGVAGGSVKVVNKTRSKSNIDKNENVEKSSKSEKGTSSSILHMVAASNSRHGASASSDSSKLSSSISIVGDSRSSSSTTYQSLDTLSSSRDKRGKKKRTPTVALPVDKYKERRGISKSPSPIHEPSLSKKKEKEVAVDNFNLDKHLKDTRKNYKHLVI